MNEAYHFLVRYGYALLFAGVFIEQIGLPVPALPFLLGAGALAGAGSLHFLPIMIVGVSAALVSDMVWFELGRRRGGKVLGLLCRISLEPDSCVRRTENLFLRYGVSSLLVAKFIPGLNTVAPPLAGIFRISVARFLVFDTIGTILWTGTFVLLGYSFSNQLEQIAVQVGKLGALLVILLAGALVLYILAKYIQRRRILNRLRVAQINPFELHRMLQAGDNVMIVDLRQRMDREAAPAIIPGALWMAPEELEARHLEIPRDREIVLYCS